ncbi:MAG: hypothetical protein J6M60_06965 [Clostridia bacterium]|nr:hypothetical protein [Clostridia bacterium]
MLKVYELKKPITDSHIVENIYYINKLSKKLMKETEFFEDIENDDFNFINVILEKTRINLEKTYTLMQYQSLENNKRKQV